MEENFAKIVADAIFFFGIVMLIIVGISK